MPEIIQPKPSAFKGARSTRNVLRKNVLLPTILVMIAAIAIVVTTIYKSAMKFCLDDLVSVTANTDILYSALKENEARMLQQMLSIVMEDEAVENGFMRSDRVRLLDSSLPWFTHFKNENRITHFYFIKPDRTVLLRVHNPARYGDEISRKTLLLAEKNRTTSWGVELGPFQTLTLRVVSPWFSDEGELIGYFELGKEIGNIAPTLSSYYNSDIIFLLDKKIIDRDKWEEGIRMMGSRGDWNLLERLVAVDNSTDEYNTNIRALEDRIIGLDNLPEHAFLFNHDGKQFGIGTNILYDMSGNRMGYMLVVKDQSRITANARYNAMVISAITMASILLLLALISRFIGHAESIIEDHTSELSMARDELRETNILLAEDIDRRRDTERALRESEQRYRLLFESAMDAILIIDVQSKPPGKIISANWAAATMHGFTIAEILNFDISMLSAPGEPGKVAERINEILKTGWLSEETDHSRKDGSVFPVELSASTFEQDGHKYIMVFGRDLTARKQADLEKEKLQKQLLQAQKMEAIGHLAGGIAHDFNNMLAIIMTRTRVAMDNLDENVNASGRELRAVMAAADRAKNLTAKMLTFAREEKLRLQPVSVNDVISEIISMLKRSVPKKIRIIANLDENLRSVDADPTQLEQAILNVCINAVDAMPGEGVLTVETCVVRGEEVSCDLHGALGPDNYCSISVSDTGSGITSDELSRIFDPFYTTKEVGKGTGLGLSTTLGIVRSHEGHISVVSAPGEGTTVKMFLPLSSNKTAAPEKKALREALASDKSYTILAIDDERDLLIGVQRLLERRGFKVFTESQPEKAVEFYRKYSGDIDLVLLDLMMPGMDGGDVFRAVRKINPRARVILASGYGEKGHAEDLMEAGVKRFIQKPYDADTISNMIRDVMNDPPA